MPDRLPGSPKPKRPSKEEVWSYKTVDDAVQAYVPTLLFASESDREQWRLSRAAAEYVRTMLAKASARYELKVSKRSPSKALSQPRASKALSADGNVGRETWAETIERALQNSTIA